MRKFSVLSLIVILALILTACAGGDAGDTGETGAEGFGTPAVGDGGLSEDMTTPSVGESGSDLTGTQTVEGGIVPPVGTDVVGQTPGAVSEATRQPTAALSSGGSGSSSGTATQSPTLSSTEGGDATQSPTQTGGLGAIIPVTGDFQFVRVSELLGYQVRTNDAIVSGSTGTQATNPTVAPTLEATSGASDQSSTALSPTQSATRSISGSSGSVVGESQLVGTVEDFVVTVAPHNDESSSGMSGSTGSTGSTGSSNVGTATPATGGTGGSTVSPSGTATPSSSGAGSTSSGMTGTEFGSLDVQNGEVVFIVVQVADSVALGDETNDLVAIPWQNVRVDVDKQVIYVDLPMSRIQEAPAFSSTNWPDVSVAGWETEWVTFWYGSSVSE